MTEKTQDIVKQKIKTQDIEVQTTNNVTYVDFQKPEEKETETSIYYEINEKVAAIANDMVSFSKYEQGSATAEYRRLVDKAAKIAEQKRRKQTQCITQKLHIILICMQENWRKISTDIMKSAQDVLRL